MMPDHIAEAVDVLRAAGWVKPLEAAEQSGRSLMELVRLTESGEVRLIKLGPCWWVGGVPFEVTLVRIAEVESAPRRPPLTAV